MLTQFDAIQLSSFLLSKPPKDYSDAKTWRKVQGACDKIEADLGDYLKKFDEFQTKISIKVQPYQEKVRALYNQFPDVADKDMKDCKTDDEISRKVQHLKLVGELQAQADSDAELKKLNDDFLEFQKNENGKDFNLVFGNPEYVQAVKTEFQERCLKHEWANRLVLKHLTDAMDTLS